CYVHQRHLHSFPTRRSSDLGPETRGGTANCAVTISDEAINSPVFSKANTLIAMNLPSLDKFYLKVLDNGNIIFNSSLIKDKELRSEEHTSELQSRENLVCRL